MPTIPSSPSWQDLLISSSRGHGDGARGDGVHGDDGGDPWDGGHVDIHPSCGDLQQEK